MCLPWKTNPSPDRRLRGSASRVNGHWLCQREMTIFDPHRIYTPQPITKNMSQVIT